MKIRDGLQWECMLAQLLSYNFILLINNTSYFIEMHVFSLAIIFLVRWTCHASSNIQNVISHKHEEGEVEKNHAIGWIFWWVTSQKHWDLNIPWIHFPLKLSLQILFSLSSAPYPLKNYLMILHIRWWFQRWWWRLEGWRQGK